MSTLFLQEFRPHVFCGMTLWFVFSLPGCTVHSHRGTHADSNTSPSPVSLSLDGGPKEPLTDPKTLGAQVTTRYRQLSELEFEALVTTKDHRIRCIVKSDRQGNHHLDVFDADKLVYRMVQTPVALDMIRFEEACPRTNKRDVYQLPVYMYSYQFDSGRRWDPRLIDSEDIGFDACLFGGYLRSWLGDDSHWSEFFGRTIAAGTYRGVRSLQGDACHIVATDRPQRPGEEFWIDVRTGLVRRWRDPARDRVFRYLTKTTPTAALASINE